MSLRRVAIRRHSDHNVAETAEEAMATLAQQAVSDKPSENPRASSPLEDEEKENVLPPTTDLDTDGLSAESEKSEKAMKFHKTHFFGRYLQMLQLAESPVDADLVQKAQERQMAYDIWHAERDPALVLFRKMFGKEWTEADSVKSCTR
eukprot:symbB.v1.2.041493.t1/scaffold8278.1/size6969/1